MARPRHRHFSTLAAALLAACATQRPAPALDIAVGGSAEHGCHATVDGRRLTLGQLSDRAEAWRGRPRRADLVAGLDTPYRCVGAIVYALQRAGFQVGFIVREAE